MATGTFAAAINCIDGRTQHAVIQWMVHHLGVQYVDLITEPGPEKMLTQGWLAQIEDLKRKVAVSVNAHHSQVVALAAHHDCAGNPVSDAEHQAQVRQGAEVIAGWELGVRVIGLWVNDQWQVEQVCDSAQGK
jgi:hypothetical protein